MLLQSELQQVVTAGLVQLCALIHKCVFVWHGGFFAEGPQKGLRGARLVNPSALACSSADCSPRAGWKQGLFLRLSFPAPGMSFALHAGVGPWGRQQTPDGWFLFPQTYSLSLT